MAIITILLILSIDSLSNAYNCLLVPGPVSGVAYPPVVPLTGPLHTHTILIKPEARDDSGSGDATRRSCDAPDTDRRSGNPPERKKLLSSLLTLPGMVVDKLISGEISV